MRDCEFGAIQGGLRSLFSSGTASSLSDSQLLDSFVGRSDDFAQAAFTALVDRHGPLVLRVCARVTGDQHAAEDAFQATFLILARKAATIRDRASVSSWLLGVARRVSSRARVQRSQRAAQERTGLSLPDDRGSARDGTPELFPEVIEEVDRLPEKYRLPIVMCYLQGMTHEDAAGQLGVPVGTLKTRLARARERLRGPLLRRGLAPSAITAWVGGRAQWAIPRHLVDATVQAAYDSAPGRAVGLSAPIAALVEGGLEAIFLSRLKQIVVFLSAFLAFVLTTAVLVSAFPGPVRIDQAGDGPPAVGEARDVVAATVKRSDFRRTTQQPGTVEAFDSVNLGPGRAGHLKKLFVDIGEMVKRGQVLAEMDAPELVAEASKARAASDQARARVTKAESALTVAQASLEAEKAKAETVAAAVRQAESLQKYREHLLTRLRGLAARNAIETQLVDEAERNAEVASSTSDQARAQLASAKASIVESHAKVQSARADIAEAQAGLRFAEAVCEQAEAAKGDSRIVTPWDGFVTRRSYHAGDYLNPVQAGGLAPLLTLIRSGKVRVAVNVPDRDAPYLDKGDRATVHIDSLPGHDYQGLIARTSVALDTDTRTVRAEIDLDNADGRLRPGQYGTVTIDLLDRHNVPTIPASALFDRSAGGAASCYRIVEGRAVRTRIRIGEEDGARVEVLGGLKEGDSVISDPGQGISDGQRISIERRAGEK
jgi:HlyD family secretion protein